MVAVTSSPTLSPEFFESRTDWFMPRFGRSLRSSAERLWTYETGDSQEAAEAFMSNPRLCADGPGRKPSLLVRGVGSR